MGSNDLTLCAPLVRQGCRCRASANIHACCRFGKGSPSRPELLRSLISGACYHSVFLEPFVTRRMLLRHIGLRVAHALRTPGLFGQLSGNLVFSIIVGVARAIRGDSKLPAPAPNLAVECSPSLGDLAPKLFCRSRAELLSDLVRFWSSNANFVGARPNLGRTRPNTGGTPAPILAQPASVFDEPRLGRSRPAFERGPPVLGRTWSKSGRARTDVQPLVDLGQFWSGPNVVGTASKCVESASSRRSPPSA